MNILIGTACNDIYEVLDITHDPKIKMNSPYQGNITYVHMSEVEEKLQYGYTHTDENRKYNYLLLEVGYCTDLETVVRVIVGTGKEIIDSTDQRVMDIVKLYHKQGYI